MTLRDKTAIAIAELLTGYAPENDREAWIAFEAAQLAWDKALDWAAQNGQLTVNTTYSRTFEVEIDKESILKGKTIEA